MNTTPQKLQVKFSGEEYNINAIYHYHDDGITMTILPESGRWFEFVQSKPEACKNVIALMSEAVQYLETAEKILKAK